ncbi:helix-turn-helix domain-containing protein [Bacillus sp. CMF21]|nr:helix-turn-helix domain-containing protein [Bacillus sp. CMF21]
MAKRNKGSKKRRKKQLMKRVAKFQAVKPVESPFIKTWLNPEIITSERTIPRSDLYLGKYEKENVEYQKELDAVYAGTLVAVERYMNHKSTLLHHCHECKADLYSKPVWLLNGKQPHECYSDGRGSINKIAKPKKKRLTEADTERMILLAEGGMTKTKIAKTFGVSRGQVSSREN